MRSRSMPVQQQSGVPVGLSHNSSSANYLALTANAALINYHQLRPLRAVAGGSMKMPERPRSTGAVFLLAEAKLETPT